jgi:hypothetical protein
MHPTHLLRGLTVLALLAVSNILQGAEPPARIAPPAFRFSAPITHENLTIFLIHGEDQLKNKNLLTLDEALEQKKVIVHETKNVGELSIENVSADEVFIQAGDIVKGGQQDRVLAFDMIVPPKSGKLPIGSFCVESGRWSGRGQESASMFGSSKDNIATKDQKIAVRGYTSQDLVWKNVTKAQMDLARNVGAPVQAAQSQSSLQLTLEHKKVLEAVEGYVKPLNGAIDGKTDVIGYAVAVNGKVTSADIYASNALFKKLWPKLLKGSAVEAVAELQKDKRFEPATVENVKAFLADAEKGKSQSRDVNKRFRQTQQESERNLLFETYDLDQRAACIRRSYVAK